MDIWHGAGDAYAEQIREMQREHPVDVLRFEVIWEPKSGHFEIRPQVWGRPMHYRPKMD